MAKTNSKPLAELTADDIEHHWEKVPKGGPDECWLWNGYRTNAGYGMLRVGKRQRVLAHRTAFWLANGYDPTPLFVCHSCDQPACVNPRHLWCGTQKDNMSDCTAKGRVKHGDDHHRRRYPGSKFKLKESDIAAIRLLHATGECTRGELAAKFGVRPENISLIIQRKIWKQVP